MTDRHFDVIVLGSGFGGCLLATILCKEGMSVAVVDRHRHPRFAIGESSTPAADLLLQELTARHDLPELQPLARFGTWRNAYPDLPCGCKRGFTFFWHGEPGGFQAAADSRQELFVAANDSRAVADTQWYRPSFDHFLANVAQQYGVGLWEDAAVTDIDHPRLHEWKLLVDHDGVPASLQADFLIDATGPAGVVLKRLGIPDATHRLRTHSSAVYGHFLDVRPAQNWRESHAAVAGDHPYPTDDSVIHHLFRDGWLWQIRFENGLTSLGFVSPTTQPAERSSAERLWSSCLDRHPELRDVLGQPRIAEFPGKLYQTGRIQHLRSEAAGGDWAALPFTAGFIDPLYSTGIAHTLSGVERLSRVLFASSETERSQGLADYSRNIVEELRFVDDLVAGSYAALDDFRLFTVWSMFYFAAAMTFEDRWRAATAPRPGFLCTDDAEYVQLVHRLSTDRIPEMRRSIGRRED